MADVLLILIPKLQLRPTGDGGFRFLIDCPNHPLHETALLFDQANAKDVERIFAHLLKEGSGEAFFPLSTRQIRFWMDGSKKLILPVLNMEFLALAKEERFKGNIPTLAFPYPAAKALHATIRRVMGLLE